MKDIKDNFSAQADQYAAFRPGYPQALFDFIFSHCNSFDKAWDCATGNGQAAKHLSEKFKDIQATDIIKKQIDNAVQLPNVTYSLQPAAQTGFAANTFDLITIAQALHWFANEDFYNEAKRVGKEGAIIAAFGYNLLHINTTIDTLIQEFYTSIIGPYWDAERKHVDAAYKTLPFPFEEIACPKFEIQYQWTAAQLIGYLNSWSAVQHYIKQHGNNPVSLIADELHKHWPEHLSHTVTFPVFMRLGIIKK